MTDTEQTTQKRPGRPRTRMKPVPGGVKYPNQGPKKRRKGISILIQVDQDTATRLDALVIYAGTTKTAVLEKLIEFEYRRLVMEGKIKAD